MFVPKQQNLSLQQNDSQNAENKILQCQQRFNIKIKLKMW